MKYYFIKQTDQPVLDLIFAGWGMDYHPFANEQTSNDLCICYDYTDLHLDTDLFTSYQAIRLISWSMGVWAAAQTFQHTSLPFTDKIAINGTLEPIHNERGIPETIFEGTLNNLSESGMDKFNRRMCGSKERLIHFNAHAPQRDIHSLHSELASIYQQVRQAPLPVFQWTKIVVGKRDLIFPATNQIKAWSGNLIDEVDEAHFPTTFLGYANQ